MEGKASACCSRGELILLWSLCDALLRPASSPASPPDHTSSLPLQRESLLRSDAERRQLPRVILHAHSLVARLNETHEFVRVDGMRRKTRRRAENELTTALSFAKDHDGHTRLRMGWLTARKLTADCWYCHSTLPLCAPEHSNKGKRTHSNTPLAVGTLLDFWCGSCECWNRRDKVRGHTIDPELS